MADTALTMTRGDVKTITITITDALGVAVNLNASARMLTFTARRQGPGGTSVFAKTTGSGITHLTQSGATLGQATVAVASADTSTLPDYPVTLVCDCQLTDNAGGKDTVIPRGSDLFTLTVYPDVTLS